MEPQFGNQSFGCIFSIFNLSPMFLPFHLHDRKLTYSEDDSISSNLRLSLLFFHDVRKMTISCLHNLKSCVVHLCFLFTQQKYFSELMLLFFNPPSYLITITHKLSITPFCLLIILPFSSYSSLHTLSLGGIQG